MYHMYKPYLFKTSLCHMINMCKAFPIFYFRDQVNFKFSRIILTPMVTLHNSLYFSIYNLNFTYDYQEQEHKSYTFLVT